MKIFIDIGHPVHVHYFKHFIKIIREKGGRVFISARDKDITHRLLRHEGLDFYNRGRGATQLLPKAA